MCQSMAVTHKVRVWAMRRPSCNRRNREMRIQRCRALVSVSCFCSCLALSESFLNTANLPARALSSAAVSQSTAAMVWEVPTAGLKCVPWEDLPLKPKTVDGQCIPMKDGTKLSAKWWIPEDAGHDKPVPALLEFIPYRKNDNTAMRDSIRHPYFAGHGYASVRVDLRGSGDSEGIMLDEYVKQEQDDALEVIEWLARQEWCTGSVGMFGKSWGGFNALQVAARQPPALKAIITICSTDDRYATDIHYSGGCMLASDQTSWGTIMLAYNSRPPDPRHVESWREKWLERLEQTPVLLEEWLQHQTRDAFWEHGSVCEDFAAIKCPVMAVSGWADGYPDGVLRLLAGLSGPRVGIVGPWSHEYPEVASPGPTIGFLQEALEWWNQWLSAEPKEEPKLPRLRAFLQTSAPPAVGYAEREGCWVAEPEWPPAEADAPRHCFRLDLGRRRLESIAGTAESERFQVAGSGPPLPLAVPGNLRHGSLAGVWCNFGSDGDYAADQREEDALALCFDSDAAPSDRHFLGAPGLTLALESDRPLALVAARLCDVAEDGASVLVSEGLLNLAHRESHASPAVLEPGTVYTVSVAMKSIGYTLREGHRWRVALSSSMFPRAWPSPETVRLSLHGGVLAMRAPSRATLEELERRGARSEGARSATEGAGEEGARVGVRWRAAEACPTMAHRQLRAEKRSKVVSRDLLTGETKVTDEVDEGRLLLVEAAAGQASAEEEAGAAGRGGTCGLAFQTVSKLECAVRDGDPLSARVRCEVACVLERVSLGADGVEGLPEWCSRVEAAHELRCTAEEFVLSSEVKAFEEGEDAVFHRSSRRHIPRLFG